MLVLHTCCAGCVFQIIEYLLKERSNSEILLFFSNSNIFPYKEFLKRLKEVKKVAKIYKLKLKIDKYNHLDWLTYLKNNLDSPLNSYPENSLRCLKCFEHRLLKTIDFLKKNGFNEFSTTLSVNLYKDTNYINQFAFKLAKENNLNYLKLEIPFKEAKIRSLELSKKYNIYRQKYCGCEFSLN